MESLQDIILRHLRRHHLKRMEPLAALIDMDGTLYDSMGGHTLAWHTLANELGIPSTREEFYLYEGRTGASTLDILFNRAYGRDATPEEKQRLYHRKTELFAAMAPPQPMPGSADMLRTFVDTGIRRILVTGSGQSSLIDRLDTDFPGVFLPGMRVTSRDVTHGKPHPEPFIRAMQIAGVTPSQAIAVENAPLGVKSASAAGAFTVAVTTGPIPREEMERAGASIVYGSMREFADALPELLLQLFAVRDC
ncbi:MAG: HAD-IA family hydrolase [Pseudoflavonifractor sp.]|nr:HAD-IA family hydrolase [Pseudoflavonifractor sp.]